MDDPHAWLALARAPGLHARQLEPWLADGRTPPAVLRESPQTLATLALSMRCAICHKEWIADGAPPAFVLRVKRDRRRTAVG